MAALSQPQDNSEHVPKILRKESFNEVFTPKETPDQRCDVILVDEKGKELKAHKQVLSEASPFFEKLLSSDMKESREGIVRLEMFSESALRNTLQFIYTGDVEILAEENARDLVVSADYFILPNLKLLAEGALGDMLNTSNCISAYYFSQTFQCKELFAKTENYITANFTAVYESNREGVLNMSNKEMEMWLSSDATNVGTEEDVFRIIRAWIDHDRIKRQKYFAELFRHVRLVFTSRDFLSREILKNDLVKDNESCLKRVVDATHLINSQNYDNLPISPRKSLKSDVVIVTYSSESTHPNIVSNWELNNTAQPIMCYFPGEGRWCKLGEIPREYSGTVDFIFGQGELHSYKKWPFSDWEAPTLASYNPYSNSIIQHIPKPSRFAVPFKWVLREIFVVNDDEIYARVSERRAVEHETRDARNVGRNKCVSFITTYKVESNSWKDVTSFNHLDAREDICIVVKDYFVYFIGGEERLRVRHGSTVTRSTIRYTDVYRYNLCKNQWNKAADFLRPKVKLSGAACNGRIFITGRPVQLHGMCECEVYSETTNEWQFIASLNIRLGIRANLLSVDDQLYALASGYYMSNSSDDARVECYDADKNEWIWKTEIPIRMRSNTGRVVKAYPARIFKGFLSNSQLKSYNPRRFSPSSWSTEVNEGKCVIM